MKQEIREKIYTALEKSEDHKLRIKSYEDMCKLLGEEKEKNGFQTRQKKRWKKEIEYIQNGREYIITRVYATPLPEEEQKLKNKLLNYNLYLILLKHSCKELLETQDPKKIEKLEIEFRRKLEDKNGMLYTVTTKQLAFELGLVNEYYKTYMGSPHELSQYLDVDVKNVEEFYDKVSSYYQQDIKETLTRLEKNKVLFYEEVYMGDFIDDEIIILSKEKNKFNDEKDKLTFDYKVKPRQLTEEEFKEYSRINNSILDSYECKNLHEYLKKYRGNNRSYYIELNQELYERLGCIRVYKAYKIAFTPNFIYLNKKSLENQLTQLFANRVLENKLKDVTRKLNELSEAIEAEKEANDKFNAIIKVFGDGYFSEYENVHEEEIKQLNKSYEDFKVLTRELINDYKRSKIKKIK